MAQVKQGNTSYKPTENQLKQEWGTQPIPLGHQAPDQRAWASWHPHMMGLLLLVLKAGPLWAFPGEATILGGDWSRGQLGTPATASHSSPPPQADIRSRNYIRRTQEVQGVPAPQSGR